jgi:hypothetical protein
MVRASTIFNSMIYCKLLEYLVFASTKNHLWVLLQKKVYMARELELLTYEATMARCSNSALKFVVWWGNNIGKKECHIKMHKNILCNMIFCKLKYHF